MVLVTPKYEMSSCSTTEQLPGFKLLRPENPNQTLTEVECLTFDFMFTTTTSSHFTNPYRSIITKKREIMTPRFPLKRSVSLDTIDTVDSIDTLDIETKFVERVCTKMKKAALFVAGTNRQAKDDSTVAKEKRGGISLSSILRRSSDQGVKFESCEQSVGSAESKDVWKQVDDERDKSFHDDDDSENGSSGKFRMKLRTGSVVYIIPLENPTTVPCFPRCTAKWCKNPKIKEPLVDAVTLLNSTDQ